MPDHPINWPPPAPTGQQPWPAASAGWTPPRTPPQYASGLFPGAPVPAPAIPPRPTYREPHPVRPGAIAVGSLATALWLLLTGLLGQDLRGYAFATLAAGVVAWALAIVLTWLGDRGVATGVALAMSAGWSIAAVAIATHWAVTGSWPLW
ncbi:hypothetical protein ACN27F_16080 [Solwaraspora sp. WMMB335]|uniref:hypothetical protein n=1 Tax=Solwaraspora sp. WMMB335 TaxID=3404118 RepID=UPI003B94F2C3